TRRWVEHFRARGHDVRLFSLEPAWDESTVAAGGAFVRLPAMPLPGAIRYPLAVPPLRRALRAFAPDLVDAHFVPNYGLMGALAGFRPLSVAAWGSDLLLAQSPWRRARARWVLERAALVLCDAENLADAARRAGARDSVVRVIPWGVDRAVFQPREREPGLVISTRMHEDVYDLPTLIEAAARVLPSHPASQLVGC